MSVQINTYLTYVIQGILSINKFGIKKVSNLLSLKTICFLQSEYKEIELLIKEGDIEGVKNFREDQPRTGQYLDIILFIDQDNKQYIVTIFDSEALEQDPQIMEVYPLFPSAPVRVETKGQA